MTTQELELLETAKGLIDEAASIVRDFGRRDLTQELMTIYYRVDELTRPEGLGV